MQQRRLQVQLVCRDNDYCVMYTFTYMMSISLEGRSSFHASYQCRHCSKNGRRQCSQGAPRPIFNRDAVRPEDAPIGADSHSSNAAMPGSGGAASAGANLGRHTRCSAHKALS